MTTEQLPPPPAAEPVDRAAARAALGKLLADKSKVPNPPTAAGFLLTGTTRSSLAAADEVSEPLGFGPNLQHIIPAPRLTAIFLGRDYGFYDSQGALTLTPAAQKIDAFLGAVMDSPYLSCLNGYFVGTGTYAGYKFIDHDPGAKANYSNTMIAQYLTSWIDQGLIEAPSPDDISHCYAIFVSGEITLTLDGVIPEWLGFTAYHCWANYKTAPGAPANLFYAAITAEGGTGTYDVSHELCEMLTDRDLQGWHGTYPWTTEIADICDKMQLLKLGTYDVAPYWRHDVGRPLSQDDLTPPPPPLGSLKVTVSPDPIPMNKPTQITVTTNDLATGQPVTGAVVSVQNYSPARNGLGGDLLSPQVIGHGSPVTTKVTFRPGRETVMDSSGRPHQEFDLPPSISVTADGYSPQTELGNFDMA